MTAPADGLVKNGRRWQFGWCEYIELSRELLVHGVPKRPEPKLLDLLQYLLERAPSGNVIEKSELLLKIWGPHISDQSLATAISKLRAVLGGSRNALILRVPGIGYRMAVPVSCTEDHAPNPVPFVLREGDAIPHRTQWFATELLGGEGFNAVWLAENRITGERRVYKFAQEGVRLRALRREVTLSRLFQLALKKEAAFLVKVIGWNFDQSPFFTESEYGGFNLLQFAATEDFVQLNHQARVTLAAELVEAVAAAHAVGALHNDLKPSNILISPRDENAGNPETHGGLRWQIKVADFGVGSFHDPRRLLEMQITHHESFGVGKEGNQSTPGGSAMYRAPELSSSPTPTIKGDVYALGIILYQLVSGLFGEPPSPGWESRVTDPLLQRDIADAANVNPEKRLASAADLAVRLRTLEERRAQGLKRLEEEEHVRQAAATLAAARMRRPWIVLATSTLVLALCASLWLYRRADQQRRMTEKEFAAQSGMLSFLSDDILRQSDPYSMFPSPKHKEQTLLEAIGIAAPQIDARFARDPVIAAQLHETIGDVLRRRTRFQDADREYALAAERYRQAGGELSQDAQVVDLKRVSAELAGRLPGFMERVKAGLSAQHALAARLKGPAGPKLRAWQAYTEAGLLGIENKPDAAQEKLDEAARAADQDPQLKRSFAADIKLRSAGVYIYNGDGGHLERVAREVIASELQIHGPQSAFILPAQMYLQEAFYLQGKYREAIEQSKQNRARFLEVLGPDHQLTLGTLANQAAAEAQLEDYQDAVRDDLELNRLSATVPSGERMAEGSLHDAALYECHMGRFESGLRHARQVQAESSGPHAQPLFAEGSKQIFADCILGEQERRGSRPDRAALQEVESLLQSINLPLIAQFLGTHDTEQTVTVDRARLAFLRGQFEEARNLLASFAPAMNTATVDQYDKRQFLRLTQALAARGLPPTR